MNLHFASIVQGGGACRTRGELSLVWWPFLVPRYFYLLQHWLFWASHFTTSVTAVGEGYVLTRVAVRVSHTDRLRHHVGIVAAVLERLELQAATIKARILRTAARRPVCELVLVRDAHLTPPSR